MTGKPADDLFFTTPVVTLCQTDFCSRVADRAEKELGLRGLRVHDLRPKATFKDSPSHLESPSPFARMSLAVLHTRNLGLRALGH
jgi:hypothetical protein